MILMLISINIKNQTNHKIKIYHPHHLNLKQLYQLKNVPNKVNLLLKRTNQLKDK
jgi:hypothetical protein